LRVAAGKRVKAQRLYEVHLNAGEMIIFKGNLIHAGCGYKCNNIRLHAYISFTDQDAAAVLNQTHPIPNSMWHPEPVDEANNAVQVMASWRLQRKRLQRAKSRKGVEKRQCLK